MPPAAALPDISVREGAIEEGGLEKLETVIWAARRLGLPIGVGGDDAEMQLVLAELRKAGIAAREVPGGGGNAASLRWITPAPAPLKEAQVP